MHTLRAFAVGSVIALALGPQPVRGPDDDLADVLRGNLDAALVELERAIEELMDSAALLQPEDGPYASPFAGVARAAEWLQQRLEELHRAVEQAEMEEPPDLRLSPYCVPEEQLCNEAGICFCPERGTEL
jgi:hypothetical protein